VNRDIKKLKAIELDALRELGNIGAGNAATALSKMLGSTVTIDVPKVSVVPLEQVPELLGGSETVMAGVYMKVFGDAPCKILVFLPEPSVQSLLDLLMPSAGARPEGLNEAAQSALKELGNILGCNYLNAMSRLLNLQFVPSVPALAVDMVGSIITEAVVDLAEQDLVAVFIENQFQGAGQPVTGHFFLIPEAGAAEVLLTALLGPAGD
jgi:chemotaxis protein CheC